MVHGNLLKHGGENEEYNIRKFPMIVPLVMLYLT